MAGIRKIDHIGIAVAQLDEPLDGDRAVFQPWANVERFDRLREAHSKGELIPFPELIQSSPQEYAKRGDGSELIYYAQVWALIHYIQSGEDRAYRPGMRTLLADAAAGRARNALANRYGRDATIRILSSRRGAEMLALYCDTDPVTIGVGYDRFIDSIVRSGARNRITAGRSPLD